MNTITSNSRARHLADALAAQIDPGTGREYAVFHALAHDLREPMLRVARAIDAGRLKLEPGAEVHLALVVNGKVFEAGDA